MGKFYNALITTTDPQERASSISNFFGNLDGITSELVDYSYNDVDYFAADISIDGTSIELLYGIQTADANGTIKKLMNDGAGIIDDTPKGTSYPAGITVSAYIDEKCTMIFICRPGGNDLSFNTYSNCVEVISLDIGNDRSLIGYCGNGLQTAQNMFDISNLTFKDVNNVSGISYSYTNMFPYVAISGTIDFLAQSYFVNNTVRRFTSDILRECSTVTLGSTVSLPDGNYVALGAHCLAPLDDEEVSE